MKVLALFLTFLLLPVAAVRAAFNYLTYDLMKETATYLTSAPDVKAEEYRTAEKMLFVQDTSVDSSYYISVFEVTHDQAQVLGWGGTDSAYYAYSSTAWNTQPNALKTDLSFPTEAQWLAYADGDVVPFCNTYGAENGGLFQTFSLDVWYGKNANTNYKANKHGVFDIYGNVAEYISDTEKFNGGWAADNCDYDTLKATPSSYNDKLATAIPNATNGKGLLGARLVYTPAETYTVTVKRDGATIETLTNRRAGEKVVLTPPTVGTGYELTYGVTPEVSDWVATQSSISFTMPATAVTVSYTTKAFVTVTLNGVTQGTPSAYAAGEAVTIRKPTVGAGIQLSAPSVPGTVEDFVTTSTGGTFTMPTPCLPITIRYTTKPILTITLDEVTVSQASYAEGTSVTFTPPTAELKSGYVLSNPSVKPNTVSLSGNTFTMPGSPVTIAYRSVPCVMVTLDGVQLSVTPFEAGTSVNAKLDKPTVADNLILLDPTYTTHTPEGDRAVTVERNAFTMPATPVTIAYQTGATFTLKLNGRTESTQTVVVGTTINFTRPTVDTTGYKLSAPEVTPSSLTLNGTSFVMPAEPVTINYDALPFRVIKVVNGTTTKSEVIVGDTFTITAKEATLPQCFKDWKRVGSGFGISINGEGVTAPTTAKATMTVTSINNTYAGQPVTFTAQHQTYPRVLVEGGTATLTSGTSYGGGYYSVGATLTLTPAEKTYQRFKAWQTNGYTYSPDANATVTVGKYDTTATYTATYVSQPRVLVHGGSVSLISGKHLGSGYYTEGSTFTITAPKRLSLAPADATAEKVFSHWNKNGVSVTTNPLTITANGSETTTYTAVYTANTDKLPSRITKIGEWTGTEYSRIFFGYSEVPSETYGNTSSGNAFIYYGVTVANDYNYASFTLEGLDPNYPKYEYYSGAPANEEVYWGKKLLLKRVFDSASELPFYIGVYETSITHYNYLVNGSAGNDYYPYHPYEYKGWKSADNSAQKFLTKLNETFGWYHGCTAAFPTTTQVEKAAGRGANIDSSVTENMVHCSPPIANIGSKSPSHGFYDLWGNLAEYYSDINAIRGGDASSPFIKCNLDSGTDNDTFAATFRPVITLLKRCDVTIAGVGTFKVFPWQDIYLAPQVSNTKRFLAWSDGTNWLSQDANGITKYNVGSNVTLTPIWADFVQEVTLWGSEYGWTGPSTMTPGQSILIYLDPNRTLRSYNATAGTLTNNYDGTLTFTIDAYTTETNTTIWVDYEAEVIKPGYHFRLK